MNHGRTFVRLLTCMSSLCLAIALAYDVRAADDKDSVSIEWAYLATYPEADCTKIHLYVKNTGEFPLFLEGIHLDEKFLDLGLDRQEALNLTENSTFAEPNHIEHNERAAQFSRTSGSLQWHRALPNPVEPEAVTDVTVSLWGSVKEAAIRIPVRGGGELRWDAKEEPRALRLSQICFDPADPNKIYVYCENKTDKDIAVDHVTVNTEDVEISKSIPSGNAIEAGKKSCFIVHPKQKMIWGKYAGVGVVGKGGEKVLAVVRVINFFPIGSCSVDTRPEMFFDSVDLRKPMPEMGKGAFVADAAAFADVPVADNGSPCQAFYDGRDPACDKHGWEWNAERTIHGSRMLYRSASAYDSVYFTHICTPVTKTCACFAELADLIFVNPYTILFRAQGPEASGRWIAAVRNWNDPRPVMSLPEAFVDKMAHRNLTPQEVSFALWSEIAEGSKGVRYYVAHANRPSRGYDDLPGLRAQIADDNVKLQFLRPFLRVSDTWSSSDTFPENVACKLLVLGDKGFVFIVMNRDYAGKQGIASRWSAMRDTVLNVTLPGGMLANGRLFLVEHGLLDLATTVRNNRLEIPVGGSIPVQVYLYVTSTPTASFVSARASRAQLPVGAFDAKAVLRDHIGAQCSRLLHPTESATLSDTEVIAAGIATRVRWDAVVALLSEQLRLLKGHKDWTDQDVGGILREYLNIGAIEEGKDACLQFLESTHGTRRQSLCRALGNITRQCGQYDLMICLMTRGLEEADDRQSRLSMLNDLIDMTEKDVNWPDETTHWLEERLASEQVHTRGWAETAVMLARNYLDAHRYKDSFSVLLDIDATHYNDLPVDFIRGKAALGLNDRELAKTLLRRASSRSNRVAAIAHYQLAVLLTEDGKYGEAQREFRTIAAMRVGTSIGRKAEKMAASLPANP